MNIDRNALAADENQKQSTATEVAARQQRAEDLLRKVRERREEEIRSELREKIAAGVEALLRGTQAEHVIARIRAGELG